MPKIETWTNLPAGIRQHLIDRMRDRAISIDDLNQLRLWIESTLEVPESDWVKDFGSFKICGSGRCQNFSATRTSNQGTGYLTYVAV